MNYYNEWDKHAAAWLRELIKDGLIPPGEVDERSIEDVHGSELKGFTQCHFFCGIAGWPHALELAGWPTSRRVWTGSPPCQPFSFAGLRKGQSDGRHMWPEFFRLIRECKPPIVFIEQVARAINFGWLDGVAGDLEGIDYSVGAAVLQASGANAPHQRERLWIAADAKWNQQPRQESRRGPAGRMGRKQQLLSRDGGWQAALAKFRALDDGLPRYVAATDAARNAIVPQIAAQFIEAYLETQKEPPCKIN